MQSSSSFSNSRTGKSRPTNLLSTRPEPSESLPWPSPSFNLSNQDGLTVSADPDRPSSQIKISPTGRLPPTPLTATYKPIELPSVGENKSSGDSLRLPSVSNLLALTPPKSSESRTVPLPPTNDEHDLMEVDAPIRTGYSPKEVSTTATMSQSMPKSTSKTGIFQGTSSEWRGDNASFSQMNRRPTAPQQTLNRRQSVPVSPNSFRNMPSSNEVQGLGLDLGEETPRLGSGGSWAMMTPTMSSHQQQLPGLPGAPQMSSMQIGRFPTGKPSSPIKPPLRNWNTDLRFENRQFTPRPFVLRSSSDGMPTSIAMERERAVEIEGAMPLESHNWGLALSTDNGQTYRRGSLLHRSDGSVIGPAPAQPLQLAGPPTPTHGSFNFASASVSSASKAKTQSPSMPLSASKRSHASTGLTPHIHKTRLTPVVSSSSKGKGKLISGSSDAAEVGSPSLKMKSKQRSDQLREQAEFIVSRGHLPIDIATPMTAIHGSSSSPTSPTRDEDFDVIQEVHSRTAPPSVSPRHKRGLTVRKDGDSNKMMDSSPWGVFGINTSHDAWQPLGPPALSKVLGKLELTENHHHNNNNNNNNNNMTTSDSIKIMSKKARKGSSSSSAEPPLFRKERSGSPTKGAMHRYGSEDKENDVFGSSTTAKGNKRTPNSSVPPSPTKSSSTFGQRRLINIR